MDSIETVEKVESLVDESLVEVNLENLELVVGGCGAGCHAEPPHKN